MRQLATILAIWAISGMSDCWAQGVLVIVDRPIPLPRPIPMPRPVPQPQPSYVLKQLAIQATLRDQIAHVQASQTFHNPGSVPLQVQFMFPLPYDGAVDSLTLMVDGKEFPAQLLSAKEARERYQAIVRTNKDPALLEYLGTGMFQTSVLPVPAGADRTVTLTYHQILRQDHGLTDFLFPLSTAKYTAKPVEQVSVHVALESSQPLRNIYSPTHPVDIERTDPQHAVVKWERKNETPGQDFRLFYDVGATELATRVFTFRPNEKEDGYFLLLVTPPVQEKTADRPQKTVLFVVDKSGSMSGNKIEQARGALRFVLDNLREGDLFNIIAYEGQVESFRPELQRYSDETRKAAHGYINGLHAGGGTNIHAALTTGLNQLQDRQRPNFVFFLTDGLPTVGTIGEAEIANAAKAANQVRARLLPFGVGYDVNSRLLDRLARANFGLSEYVRPDEDIEAHVSRAFERIASPVLTDVQLNYAWDGVRPEDAPPINRQYPKEVVDLFDGEQLVVVGRYGRTGAAKIALSGRVGAAVRSWEFTADFPAKTTDGSFTFVEKLWATRRIGEIIDQLDLQGKNDELIAELVGLSTKHGILTPYTAFLADETSRPEAVTDSNSLGLTRLSVARLNDSSGRGGFAQRSEKLRYQTANQVTAGVTFGSNALVYDAQEEREVAADGVRSAGKDVLYARQLDQLGTKIKILVTPETAAVKLDDPASKVQTIDRFSDAYFELAAANTPDENLLFVQQGADEQLLVRLRGELYLIK